MLATANKNACWLKACWGDLRCLSGMFLKKKPPRIQNCAILGRAFDQGAKVQIECTEYTINVFMVSWRGESSIRVMREQSPTYIMYKDSAATKC